MHQPPQPREVGPVSQSTQAKIADYGDGIRVVTVRDYLDLATAGNLYERGHEALSRGPRVLLLDLADLSFCDAAGLSALVGLANEAEAAGCGYGLIAPPPLVVKLLQIIGLDQRLRVFATIDEAQSHDGGGRPRTARGSEDPLRVSRRGHGHGPAVTGIRQSPKTITARQVIQGIPEGGAGDRRP
jgi:anti-sigma B factor antagonist